MNAKCVNISLLSSVRGKRFYARGVVRNCSHTDASLGDGFPRIQVHAHSHARCILFIPSDCARVRSVVVLACICGRDHLLSDLNLCPPADSIRRGYIVAFRSVFRRRARLNFGSELFVARFGLCDEILEWRAGILPSSEQTEILRSAKSSRYVNAHTRFYYNVLV